MQLQFDPFAFGAAILAFLLAWRAHYLAKKAPEVARQREIRDQIRERIDALRKATAPLATIIQLGQPMVALPADFDENVQALDDLAGRVPEKLQINGIHVTAFSLASRWSSAFHDDEQLDTVQGRAQHWQRELTEAQAIGRKDLINETRSTLDGYTKEVEKLRRAADASRTRVREGLDVFKTRADTYISWLDSLDRGKVKR